MPGPGVGYIGEIAGVKCGIGGLAVNLNPSQISLRNVIQAEGAVFRQDHWRKEGGTVLFGTNVNVATNPGDATIVALVDWHPTETVQRIVHLRGDGKVYYTNANPGNAGDPGANTFGATGSSGSGTTFGLWIIGGQDASAPTTRKLFLFRNNLLPWVVSGDMASFTQISHPAVDWTNTKPPICAIVNGGGTSGVTGSSTTSGRLVAAGTLANPHMLYFSRSGNQEIFDDGDATIATNSQLLSVFPGVGERIFSLRNYQGFIVVFKYPRGIFLVDARDPDPTTGNWIVTQVSDQIGIAPTPYAALQLENDVLFLGADAQFYLLSAVVSGSRGETPVASANLGMDLEIYQFLLDAFNRGLLAQVQSVYQPFWQTATFTVPSPSSTKNDSRLQFDFNAVGRNPPGPPRFSYSYRDKAASIALHRDPVDQIDKPMYGDYNSNIILLEQDPRTAWDGAPYPFRVQTPHSNYGEFENLQYQAQQFVSFANRNKLWQNLEVEYIPFTDATVTCTVFVDGLFRQTILITLREGGRPLGFSDSDTSAFIIGSSLLAGGVVRSTVKRLGCGSGRRISFLFENQNPGEDVALTHLYVGLNISDTTETPRR
jgi:hypothetical protein